MELGGKPTKGAMCDSHGGFPVNTFSFLSVVQHSAVVNGSRSCGGRVETAAWAQVGEKGR